MILVLFTIRQKSVDRDRNTEASSQRNKFTGDGGASSRDVVEATHKEGQQERKLPKLTPEDQSTRVNDQNESGAAGHGDMENEISVKQSNLGNGEKKQLNKDNETNKVAIPKIRSTNQKVKQTDQQPFTNAGVVSVRGRQESLEEYKPIRQKKKKSVFNVMNCQ